MCLNAFPPSFLSTVRLMESSLGSVFSFGSMSRMPVGRKQKNPVIPLRKRKYLGCWSCELH